MKESDLKLVKKPSFVEDVQFKAGDTNDIITTIRKADKIAAKERQTVKLAKILRGPNDFETCRNIWNWIKKNIPYQADKLGFEKVRLPNRAIYDAANGKGCDCKSFSVLAVDLLRENGIQAAFRFISQKPQSEKVTHVYAVAKLANGRIIIVDAVYYAFNTEAKFTFFSDITAVSNNTDSDAVNGLESINYVNHSIFIL